VEALMGASEAAEYLGVQVGTLYAYVSRGLLDSLPGTGDGRRRRYRKSDLDRLKRRSDAHAGHGPAAASALDWGAPSLDTELTNITNTGPTYRGVSVQDLVRDAVRFESVAELLWTGSLPAEEPDWFRAPHHAHVGTWPPAPAWPVDVLRVAVTHAGFEDGERFSPSPDAELRVARRLIVHALRALAAQRGRSAGPEDAIAGVIAHAFGLTASDAALRAIDAALVVVADHELNASAFTARVAASAGADMYACVSAALATFSGPKHGGACDRCAALLSEVASSTSPRSVLAARMQRGESLPGFGHPLYPDGDPRFHLLTLVAEGLGSERMPAWLDELKGAAAEMGLGSPNCDMGLALLGHALRAPPDSAVTLFAIGRIAGWLAHVREQRAQGFLLRPRARYVGR
jgi:citrate synthase